MDTQNFDSQKLIETLTSWKKGNDGQINGLQDQNSVLDEAIKVLTDGIQIDQKRIDDAIQSDKDARSAQIADLEAKVTDLSGQVTTLTASNTDLQVKVDGLTKATQDSKDALTTVVTTISDALDKAVPAEATPLPADASVAE